MIHQLPPEGYWLNPAHIWFINYPLGLTNLTLLPYESSTTSWELQTYIYTHMINQLPPGSYLLNSAPIWFPNYPLGIANLILLPLLIFFNVNFINDNEILKAHR